MSVQELKPKPPEETAPQVRRQLESVRAEMIETAKALADAQWAFGSAVGAAIDDPKVDVDGPRAKRDKLAAQTETLRIAEATLVQRLERAERADAIVAAEASRQLALKLKERITADIGVLTKHLTGGDRMVREVLGRMAQLTTLSPEMKNYRGPMRQDLLERPYLMLERLIEVAITGAATGSQANLDNSRELHDIGVRILNWLDTVAPEQSQGAQAS